MEEKKTIFISHSHLDAPTAHEICDILESEGLPCWIAPRDIPYGTAFWACEIGEAILKSKAMVFLFTNNTNSYPQHVIRELNMAMNHGVKLIPVRMTEQPMNPTLEYYLSVSQGITMTPESLSADTLRLAFCLKESNQKVPPSVFCPKPSRTEPTRLSTIRTTHNTNFVGREEDIARIHKSLMSDNKLFIQGMGGIGKSALVQEYLYQHQSIFDNIIRITFESSLQDAILSEGTLFQFFPRVANEQNEIEDDVQYCHRKLKQFQRTADSRTILVIDNFDVEEDPFLEPILTGNCTVIITTRNRFEELGFPTINLTQMDMETGQLALFRKYYPRTLMPSELHTLHQVFELVQGHTLAIELIAKLMKTRHFSPARMLAVLTGGVMSTKLQGSVKIGFQKSESIYACIRQLFNTDTLSEDELFALTNLAVFPLQGFDFSEFSELCQIADCSYIESLIRRNWIQWDENTDRISLHPLIQEVVWAECSPNPVKCNVLFHNFSERAKDGYVMSQEQKRQYGEVALNIYRKFPEITPETAPQYIAMTNVLIHLEHFTTAQNILTHASEVLLSHFGSCCIPLAQCWFSLGDLNLYLSQNEKAAKYIEKAIHIYQELRPGSEELAYAMKYLTWVYMDLIDDDVHLQHRVQELLRECTKILLQKLAFPENHPQIASLYSAYAHFLYHTQDYSLSLNYAEKSYTIFKSIYGEIHADTLSPLSVKALTLSKLGREEESIAAGTKVLETTKLLFPPKHKKIVQRYRLMAEIYMNLNHTDLAEPYISTALDILISKRETATLFYRQIAALRSIPAG